MKITFIRNTLPNYLTGWSAYYEGEKADLRHGLSLISDGSARDGWEPVKNVPEALETAQVSKQPPEPQTAPRKRAPRKRKAAPRKATK